MIPHISKRPITLAVAAAIFVSFSLAADESPRVLFSESFGNKLDKDWSWVREEPKAWHLENHSLVLLTQPGYLHAHMNDAKNVLVHPVPESGGGPVAVEVWMENDPKVQFEHGGVLWYYDDDNYAGLFKESLEGKAKLQMVLEKEAKPSFVVKEYNSTGVWLRLVVADGKVTAQFRETENENWTTVGEKPLPGTGPAKGGMIAGGAPKNPERLTTFKNFRILQLPK